MSFPVGDDGGDSALPAMANAREDSKASGLKRMRRTAMCLLAFMIALLFACVAWQADHSWLAWPRAFAEAGTVGAIVRGPGSRYNLLPAMCGLRPSATASRGVHIFRIER